jgi:hypothetical protein
MNTRKVTTDLEKALIVMSFHGIYVEGGGAHRWIHFDEENEIYDYDGELQKYGISFNNKIYGGMIEAVMLVNYTWKMMYNQSLIEWYDKNVDDEWEITHVRELPEESSRIDIVGTGKGGLV